MATGRKLLQNNSGFTLTEIMVSVGIIGVIAMVNMTMLSDNMRNQKTNSDMAATGRVFESIMGLLANPDICTRFLGTTNPDFLPTGENGQLLPGAFVDDSNNPRIPVHNERVIRMLIDDSLVMFKTDDSPVTEGSEVYENKLKINTFYLESYRSVGSSAETVKLIVDFNNATSGLYTVDPNAKHYVQEGMLNIVSRLNSSNQREIDTCVAPQ